MGDSVSQVDAQWTAKKMTCWCDSQGMRIGMTLINHPTGDFLSEDQSLGSFPHSLLSTSKMRGKQKVLVLVRASLAQAKLSV